MQWKNISIMKTGWVKKIICVVITLSTLPLLSACSGKTSKDISLYDLNKALNGVSEYTDMKYASSSDNNAEDLFQNISDMSYSKVDGFFISYASNGTGNADEIACIKVKKASDINEAVSSLQSHLQKRTALYNTYDKSQSEKLSKAVVASYGNVAVLIVGDKVTDIQKEFYKFFGE